MDKYFVMLNNPSRADNAPPMPLVDDEDVLLFESLDDANTAADNNIIGGVCGYEVFKLGEGYSWGHV